MMIGKKTSEVNNYIAILKDLAMTDTKLAWDEAFNVRCDTHAPHLALRCIVFDADFRKAKCVFSSNKRSDLVLGCKPDVIKVGDGGLALHDRGRGHQRQDE